MLEQVIGDDKSDKATNLKLKCEALTPTAKSKSKVWALIADHTNDLSSYQRSAYMGGFFDRNHPDLLKPYFDKYIEKVHDCATCGNKEFMGAFVNGACPSFAITDEFLETLNKVVSEFKGDVHHESFCRTVEKVIGSLKISKKIKDFAAE